MKNVSLSAGLLMIATAVIFSGCLKSNVVPEQPKKQTYVSVINMAFKVPSIDLFFDNTKVSQASIPAGTAFPSYSAVDPKSFAVNVKKGGSDSMLASIPSAIYDSSRFYTLIQYDDTTGKVQAARIVDDFSQLTQTSTYYRFFNLSTVAPAVDLYIDNNKVSSSRMLADNAYSDYYNQFNGFTPGSYTVSIKLANTDSVVARREFVDLQAANAYTIIFKGILGGGGDAAIGVGVLRAVN